MGGVCPPGLMVMVVAGMGTVVGVVSGSPGGLS